jgi:hypothetical protein
MNYQTHLKCDMKLKLNEGFFCEMKRASGRPNTNGMASRCPGTACVRVTRPCSGFASGLVGWHGTAHSKFMSGQAPSP